MLFAGKAIATQSFISWTSQKHTTSLICLVLCGYTCPDLTLISGPDRVGFFLLPEQLDCPQTQSHAETSLEREGGWSSESPTFFPLFLTMHMLGRSWLWRATGDLRLSVMEIHGVNVMSECQQPDLFPSPPPCTAGFPAACKKKKILIRPLPLSHFSQWSLHAAKWIALRL